MNPRRLLERMCARHRLSFQRAVPLLPLVERALVSPARLRDRILALVDANIARRAGGAVTGVEGLARDVDEEVLSSVAKVLHNWKPSKNVLDLEGSLKKLFPNGFDMGDLMD